ncbi:MAG: glycoside hydrolase [Fimbriimonadales bacterium]|nr:glycoside hydrolase [Fimbriimonadales bacterium]
MMPWGWWLSLAAVAQGLPEGWGGAWSREPGAISVSLDDLVRREGRPTVRIEHSGSKDWSLAQQRGLAVRPGDIVEASVWIRVQRPGEASVSFIAERQGGEVHEWLLGETKARDQDWRLVLSRVIVPQGVVRLVPRVTGNGPSKVWVSGLRLVERGNVEKLRQPGLPPRLKLENRRAVFEFDTRTGAWTAQSRGGRSWTQAPGGSVLVKSARREQGRILAELWSTSDGRILRLEASLDPRRPELRLQLSGTGELNQRLAYPHPWRTSEGMDLVFPLNEGVAFPVDDPSLPEQWLHLYGGHGLCMPFWIQTDGEASLLTVVDTPDDALATFTFDGRTMVGRLLWVGQRGRFGYPRRWRWELFDRGGYVAAAKRYREIARAKGLVVTLLEKRRRVPAIDLLVGSPNVWVFGGSSSEMARRMREVGFERMLWSAGGSADEIRSIKAKGFLAGEYDIYQDCMDPAQFPNLEWIHPQWTSEYWPHGLVLQANGEWERGWEVEKKGGGRIPCGVLCDLLAPDAARRRIGAVLREKPFGARFIDTTTASPWRECFHPRHPMTRSDSRKAKMDLLRLVADEFRLVTGSETGHEAAVPHVSYFEGMLSLGPFRVPDAGRRMEEPVEPAPEEILRFQVGYRYRVPLWELVYHDCVCSHWYWGDYQNKVPSVWRERDLFNILYGTAPMFLFRAERWPELRDRILQSYRDVVPVARAVGYAEMTDHRWLTEDRSVQQTRFSNGWVVTVNFGSRPYHTPGGASIPPRGFHVVRPNGTSPAEGRR